MLCSRVTFPSPVSSLTIRVLSTRSSLENCTKSALRTHADGIFDGAPAIHKGHLRKGFRKVPADPGMRVVFGLYGAAFGPSQEFVRRESAGAHVQMFLG